MSKYKCGCGCWFVTEKDYQSHLRTHRIKPPRDAPEPLDPCLFPYSTEKPKLVNCKHAGEGTVWCYPKSREKYAKLCAHCNQNPDNKTASYTLDFGAATKKEAGSQ